MNLNKHMFQRVCFPLLLTSVVAFTASSTRAADDAAAPKTKPPATSDENPHLWQPRTKSVAVFKNGFGFFMREGSVSLDDGWAVAKEIPPAKFGTLAVYSTSNDDLVDVVGSGPGKIVEFDGVDAPKDIDHKRAQLKESMLLKLELTYRREGKDQKVSGKLISLGPDFAVLENSGDNFAVPIDAISKVQILELPLRVHVSQSSPVDQGSRPKLGMAYLRDGITWIPEYSLRILDDNSAELTLRGTLVNEAEDLIHCDVNFVVGVPHFVHTDYLEPIAVGQVLRTLGASVAPADVRMQIANRGAIASNSNTTVSKQFDLPNGSQSTVTEQAEAAQSKINEAVGNLPQLDVAGGTDYTVYTKKDLIVRTGERTIVTLFVKKIAYSHIYRWPLPEAMQHYLVLHNDTDTAWTTGPVLATSGDQPLSEDLLKYTPKGARCEIPVSASINIANEKSENETDRKFKAQSPGKDKFFDLVTLSGELKLKNFEKRDVEIVIENPVPGKPISASDDGQLTSDPTKLQLLEREGKIRWRLKLKPDESKTVEYKYERYVPSN